MRRRTILGYVITAILTLVATTSPTSSQSLKRSRDSSAPSNAALQKQIDEQASRLQKLEQEVNMSAMITRQAGSGVGLIVGEYIWTDKTGRKPLRYQGFTPSGDPLRDQNGNELVGFDGSGPVIQRQFHSSAFTVDSKHVLTSGYILAPWSSDPLLDESENPQIVPSLTMLHAYFPDVKTAIDLEIKSATEAGNAVLCTIKGEASIKAVLNIGDVLEPDKGEPVVMLGYPGGVELLMSQVPDDVQREIYKFGVPSIDEAAEVLAQRGFIQPIAFKTRISGRTEDRLFFETIGSSGTTGGPLINASGQVVGMSQSTHTSFPSFNMAIAVAPLKSWIEESGSAGQISERN